MRVLHVIQRYWPYVGGSERYFQELSERLVRDGHHVFVYTTDAWDLEHLWSSGKRTVPPGAEAHNGVQIRRFPVRRLPPAPLSYPATRRLMSLLSRLPGSLPLLFALARTTPWVPSLERALSEAGDDFDLVHATNIPFDSLIYAALRLARRSGVPFVLTPFTHLGEPGNDRVRRWYTMPHQIEMMKRSDAVLVQTNLERGYLAGRGVPEERMIKVGVGVNPEEVLGGDGERARSARGLDGPVVLHLGTMAYDKGTVHLVEAMRRLWDHGSDACLVLAGPTMGPFLSYFRALPASVQGRCRLLGFVPEQDKRDLLAAADVLALPSRTDSFGIVFLEAWLYEKPVVGAAAGGVPEVIDHGRDGFLVPFGDVPALAERLRQLLTDRRLATELGRRGREKVLAGCTWDRVYADVCRIYRSVVAARRAT